ncbi:ABC transporter ATP-binding protein [Mobilicoccus caccae]|uniref:ABC transporter ATP-binding protein n=1 Tax=Mobilicoccus caccae TaxID=1859295 RepID=UPI0024E1971A|nr:ABC transporter ATP-binding protein [Mobilicoccus caccae]
MLAGLVVVLVLRAVSAWAENHLSHVLSFEVSHDLRDRLVRAFAHLLPHGLGRRSVPQLTQIALGDCEKVEVFYAHTAIYLVSAIVTPAVLLAGLATVQPVAAVVVLACLVLGAALPALTRVAGARAAESASDATGMLRDTVESAVAGVREIVSLGLEPVVLADLAAAEDAHQRGRHRRLRISALEESLTTALVTATPLAMAGVLTAHGTDAALTLVLTGVATAVMVPVEVLLRVTRHTGDTRAAARRIGTVLTTPDPVDRSGRLPMPTANDIEVDGVSFSWAGAPAPTLTDVRASFPAGTTTAVVGASGAGKSTLVAVLARHVRPERGTVTLGGIPIERIDPDAYDLVTIGQDVRLFHDTVRANLTLGAEDAPTDDRLWEVLRHARVDDVVRRLDGGFDAVVGERGGRLSGGERQRLALARALLADASVIVLDEAVSQVDTAGEAALHAALRRLGPRTVVMVAHRLSTILSADRVVVMDHGRVVDQGVHDDLMSGCPEYRALVEPQLAAITPVTADIPAPPTQRRKT